MVLASGFDLRQVSAKEVMHTSPRTIRVNELAAMAAEMMETHSITSILVLDADDKLCGIVHISDLMRAKVI